MALILKIERDCIDKFEKFRLNFSKLSSVKELLSAIFPTPPSAKRHTLNLLVVLPKQIPSCFIEKYQKVVICKSLYDGNNIVYRVLQ